MFQDKESIFAISSSAGCREDYLEISGSRICGSQVGSVLFPVEKNSQTTKLTFVSNGSGNQQPLYYHSLTE